MARPLPAIDTPARGAQPGRFASLSLLAIVAACFDPARAADIWQFSHGQGDVRQLVIEGEIAAGDFDVFIERVREGGGLVATVNLYSPGGDFYEAMKIGRAVRALQLFSRVPMSDDDGTPECAIAAAVPRPKNPANCVSASAAFFMHIGGVHRSGTWLAVHRPAFVRGRYGEMKPAEAEKVFAELQGRARDYMQEMGVARHIQEEVLATPSDRALRLDRATIDNHFRGYIPYLHEWIRNRCARLSDAERARDRRYATRAQSPDTEFSAQEKNDIGQLRRKKSAALACELEAVRENRIRAYRDYFGVGG